MSRVFLLVFLCCALLPRVAGAELRAQFAFAGRSAEPGVAGGEGGGSWELLRIQVPDVGPGELTLEVQDARGGLLIARPLDAHGTDEVLMPLPLVALADAPVDTRGVAWPIEITLRRRTGGQTGEVIDRTLVRVPVPLSTPGYRLVIPRSARPADLPAWDRITTAPVLTVEMDDEVIATGTPPDFAAADAVLLTPSLLSRVTTEQVAAIVSAGTRVIAVSDGPPALGGNAASGVVAVGGGGGGGGLVWDRLDSAVYEPRGPGGAGATLWRCPVRVPGKPAPVEPGLARLPQWQTPAPLPRVLRNMLLATGPLALVLVLLARGLFRRNAVVLAAAAVALGGLMVGAIAWLSAGATLTTRECQWQVAPAAAQTTAGGVATEETLSILLPAIAQELRRSASPGALMMPLAASNSAYFARRARLTIDVPSDASPQRHLVLEAALAAPPHSPAALLTRTTLVAGLLPPYPETPDQRRQLEAAIRVPLESGWWVEGGTLAPGSAPRTGTGAETAGEGVPQWAQQHPRLSDAARAWYELRLDPRHRYFLWEGVPVSGSRSRLQIVDFGPGGQAAGAP